jgi:hypothetical protein
MIAGMKDRKRTVSNEQCRDCLRTLQRTISKETGKLEKLLGGLWLAVSKECEAIDQKIETHADDVREALKILAEEVVRIRGDLRNHKKPKA